MYNPVCPNCQKEMQIPGEIPPGGIFCPNCKTRQKLFAPGTMLGNYKILRFISCGNMGCVYLAEQVTVDRKVALKVLDENKAKKTAEVEKFLNEARNTVRFSHPNIVNAIDAGLFGDVYGIAVQYVEGENLETLLGRGKIYSPTEALRIVLTIAEALKTIWNRTKMFHKDIKPANIMITPEGDPMLLDMGIAQNLGEGSVEEGVIEGTPLYMSPEQAKGEKLSWSTDCYSLGATLFHMVTGTPPFWDEDVNKILEKHCFAPIPNPDKVYLRNTGKSIRFPDAFRRILEKMLAKTQATRYRSWEDVLEDMTGSLILLEELHSVKGFPKDEMAERLNKLSPSANISGNGDFSREKVTRTPFFPAKHPVFTAVVTFLFLVILTLTLYWHLSCKKDVDTATRLLTALESLTDISDSQTLKKGKNLYGKLQDLSANSLPINIFYAARIKEAGQNILTEDARFKNDQERLLAAEKTLADTFQEIRRLLDETGSKAHFPSNIYEQNIHFTLTQQCVQTTVLTTKIREKFLDCKNTLLREKASFRISEYGQKCAELLLALETAGKGFESTFENVHKEIRKETQRLEKEKKKLLMTQQRKKPLPEEEGKKKKQLRNSKEFLLARTALYTRKSKMKIRKLVLSFHDDFSAKLKECKKALILPDILSAFPDAVKQNKNFLAFVKRVEDLYKEGETFHNKLADSDNLCKGFIMKIPKTKKTAALLRIKKGEALFVKDYDNWKFMLKDLSRFTLVRLSVFAVNKNGNFSPFHFAYYLRIKAYDKALDMINPASQERKILSILLYDFLSDEHKKRRGRPSYGLTRKYKNTPEFKKIFGKKGKGRK